MGPAHTIESLSPASASTSAPHQQRALASELSALQYFLKKNHELLYHRKKLFGVEIDLILHDEEGIIQLVEVKTYTNLAMLTHRLTQKQKSRLIFAKTYFESTFALPTQVILATVKGDDIDDFIIG